jgi:hypothetical protein
MERIELQFDEQTLVRARRLAESRHSTLEALIAALIARLDETEAAGDPLLGLFTAEPELLGQVVESAMQAREEHPLRASDA